MGRRFDFFGDNALGYNSRDPEVLLAGPAGSGKTLVWLCKVLTLCGKYPGSRVLVVRKTRESLTESVLVTWERDVLGPHHPVLTRNPTLRRVRQAYTFANGSAVVVGGLDKPDKVLSSEWDMIYVPEATDVTLVDWETLGGRLRAGVVPFQQLAADCNPTTPTHWLFRRQAGGALRMFSSTHRDNPRYWDRAAGEWTPAGRAYLARLGAMTGARRARFLDGKWQAAEGLVYDGYDPKAHLLPAGWTPPPHWRRLWAIDWGFSNPICLQFWAVDGDGRAYLYREFYHTQTRVEQLARWAVAEMEAGREPRPEAVVCDHDPECQATFEKYSGLSLELADKADKDGGIEEVQARFDRAADGRPRLFIVDDCRANAVDQSLLDAGKPSCTQEELLGYVWDTRDPARPKDIPLDKDNHGMDSMRYMMKHLANRDGSGADCYGAPAGAPPIDNLPGSTWSGRPEGKW